MQACWEKEPKERPEFGEIVTKLSQVDVSSLENEQIEETLPPSFEKPKIDYQLSISVASLTKYTPT
jgi:hypothetical protein